MMRMLNFRLSTVATLSLCFLFTSGCAELRGRRSVREGNAHYKELRYTQAVEAYERAERFLPNFPTLWLNKGIACRQLLTPGLKTPENDSAAKCAIDAFTKLRQLRPDDPRGEQLYLQTLFDADRFDDLSSFYSDRLRKNSADLEAVNGLIQVYSKSNRLDDTLQWYRRKADLQPDDAEAQYAVGVYIWQQLFLKGGSGDKATYDPRPNPDKPKDKKDKKDKSKEVSGPPPFSVGDVVGRQRIEMSDTAYGYLQKAVAVRPKYVEAMVYLNLVQRQKAIAFFNEPAKWEACVNEALKWQKQVTDLQAAVAAASASSAPSAPPPGATPTEPASHDQPQGTPQ
jgi:tetratricopeptide (TPR) repeat protein